MDLKSGYPFWAIKNGLLHAFPPLQHDVRCDVAVIGGGITGALITDELVRHGFDVTVIDQRDVGWGSTAASTALVQYEIDEHMVDLAKKYGEADAVLVYQACAAAIPMLQKLAAKVRDVDFSSMDSLYYASKRRHASALRDEFALRKLNGFDVELLEHAALQQRFGIDAPTAILSHQAARVDPYRMAYRLLMRAQKAGARVYDQTIVKSVEPTDRGVTLRTSEGCTVRSNFLVLAAGYANQDWLKQRVARNSSSYALITDPLSDAQLGALKHTMIWESARPYLYMRTTGDGRLLVGGEDDAVDIPIKRDARVGKKSRILCKRMKRLLPHLSLQPVFAWAGTFAETKDGLPFFGAHNQTGPRVHFAMAYGGNGITYSMLGAGLIRALIERREHPLAQLFSFQRLQR